jgi:uncharacterized protein YlzI (FlbEa/FlbD family)
VGPNGQRLAVRPSAVESVTDLSYGTRIVLASGAIYEVMEDIDDVMDALDGKSQRTLNARY